MKITLPSIGITIHARNNFYNWAISIDSRVPIHDFSKAKIKKEKLPMEGFDDSYIYESYVDGSKQFSFHFKKNEIDLLLEKIFRLASPTLTAAPPKTAPRSKT
ncbi:MAG TPA: hypothetical protein DF383_10870 [Deltaproteobacteria bacterium]|nr:hypothetical protein [Deltaproteobacteria bacterium]